MWTKINGEKSDSGTLAGPNVLEGTFIIKIVKHFLHHKSSILLLNMQVFYFFRIGLSFCF